MRIAMFSNTYLPAVGGIETSIDVTAWELRRRGHAVLVVAPEYVEAQDSDGTTLRVPAIKQFAGTPFSINLSLPFAAADQIAQFGSDLIHSHQPFLLGDSALRLARTLGIPIVCTNHTFMERYLHWFPVDLQILRDIAETLPVAYANLVDHVIAPTRSVEAVLRARGTVAPIAIIPTGIDAAFYGSADPDKARRDFGIEPGARVIGHLGRLNAEKNLAYLAEVAVRFVAQDPQQHRFLLVGAGDAVNDIRQRFDRDGLLRQLIQPGQLRGEACAAAYAAMDAFVFTSLTDTQGLVLSEAMAGGNPVFALDAPGARDIIEHDRTGWLFDADTSPERFAAVMAEQIADAGVHAQRTQDARRSAQALSVERCTQSLLDLYLQVVSARISLREGDSAWDRIKSRWDVEVALLQEKWSCLVR